ncbi:MAG: Holliday junction branch migration protein RuvA [Elusimicrobia bacterium]|nr:Holliday junction branch migration protein RuvA [Elusimicrobiota bacterium]
MIAYIKGKLIAKTEDRAVIEAGGIGYEVFFCAESLNSMGDQGTETAAFIAESVSMYGGTALYGFLSAEEKNLFELFREAVPNTGAKKALDYLAKALKSLPDFKQAVIKNDLKLLVTIFGFTAKTAEKLIAALKYKMPDFETSGDENIRRSWKSGAYAQVLSALATLGFKAGEAKAALDAAGTEAPHGPENAEQLLKRTLKRLSPK